MFNIKEKAGRQEIILDLVVVVATLIVVVLISLKYIPFGDQHTWLYPYVRGISYRPFLVASGLIALMLLLAFYTEKYLDRHPGGLMGIWFVSGTIAQITLHSLYMNTYDKLISHNAYSDFVRNYSLVDLLRHYDSLSSGYYHLNIQNNMPGKAIMVKLLDSLTGNPYIQGLLLILISNLGAILVYFICMKLFERRRVAIYAFILYLFLPAKIFFLTQPNIITPVFILTCFLLLLLYLEKGRAVYACLFGVSIYLLMYFEATPLVLCIVFLAFVLKYLREKKTNMLGLLKGLLYAAGAFALVFVLFLVVLDFNIVSSMISKYSSNWSYIGAPQFGYLRAIVLNLREFFLNLGVAQSILLFVSCGCVVAGIMSMRKKKEEGRGLPSYLLQPGQLLLISFFLTLLVLDLLGVNRAEITRTWIYMMVFAQMCVACFIAKRCSRITFYLVLACTILQTAVTMSMVGFVL